MSSFVLKIIAIISMVFDHVGDACIKHLSAMNLIGRLAFPIFAFQISEGYYHTKNLKKYFLRLFLFALISQIPFMLFMSTYTNAFSLNIFCTLFVGLLAIFIHDKVCNCSFNLFKNTKFDICIKQFIGILIAILLGLIAEFCHFDYGLFGIAIIFIFYLFKNHKITMSITYILACILNYGYSAFLAGFNNIFWYVLLTTFTIIPIVFICLYNGKQGKKVKYLLYFFYPVHYIIIYLIFK